MSRLLKRHLACQPLVLEKGICIYIKVVVSIKIKGLYRKLFWGRGDGSVSQALASQTRELEFNSQDPRQSSGKGVHACNPGPGEMGTRGSWGCVLAAQLTL